MSDFTIKGAEDFLRLSKALKAAGRTEMRKTLHKGMKDAVKPLVPKARASARNTLPKAGGLNKLVASASIRPQVRTGRNAYGVRVVVGNKAGARATNRGLIRHPVFGNREVWKDQKVPAGWFDDVMEAGVPGVRADVERALARVVDDIIRDAKH
jgi:hypothetical protein